jgi:outer membrane protein assembly factor BamB
VTPSRLVATLLVVAVLGGCAGGATRSPSPSSAPTGSAPTAGNPSPPAGSIGRSASGSPSASPASGTPASGPPASGPPASSAGTSHGDWPVYHRDAQRTGYDPGFPAPAASLRIAWSARLDGAVYAEPLVIGGSVIAATENDSVYALDGSSGAVRWRRHLGTPVPLSSLPCGNIDPLGITGTPAYDPGTASLFAVAEVAGPHHVLFALDPSSGAVRWSRTIDLPGDDPATHQQRPALAVANGYVYVGIGGLDGDCGQYRGKVVGVPVGGQGPTLAYRVPTSRMGAVWATAGPAVDGAGHVYVSVGNGSSTTTYDGTDSVLELSPTLQLLSRFAPSGWAADNAGDADLGSLGPVLVPGGFVFIDGKSGTAYTLRQGHLGGIGGQVASAPLCRAFGGAALTGSIVFVPCTDGLRAVRIGADGSIHPLWRTPTGANGSPVAAPGVVWSLDLSAGVLYALDASNGSAMVHVAVGDVPHFASPTLWQGRVLVGTMGGVVAVAAGG